MVNQTANQKTRVSRRLKEVAEMIAYLSVDQTLFLQELMAYGEKMPPMTAPQAKQAKRLIGCVSETDLYIAWSATNTLILSGKSNAWIIQGYIALLKHIWEGSSPTVVVATADDLKRDLSELQALLSTKRGIGLAGLLQEIVRSANKQAQTL